MTQRSHNIIEQKTSISLPGCADKGVHVQKNMRPNDTKRVQRSAQDAHNTGLTADEQRDLKVSETDAPSGSSNDHDDTHMQQEMIMNSPRMASLLIPLVCISLLSTHCQCSPGVTNSTEETTSQSEMSKEASQEAPKEQVSLPEESNSTTEQITETQEPPIEAEQDAAPPETGNEPIKEQVTQDTAPPQRKVIRGRFESGSPVRQCGDLVTWNAPDGLLLRAPMNLCGDDIAALAATIKKNLDAIEAKGGRALVMLIQGINLPPSWLTRCKTWKLQDGRFSGDICLPWDTNYQKDLKTALTTHLAPVINGHKAVAGVYFTITTMTNGAELHFRADRSTFPYPGDKIFHQSYFDIMKLYQDTFDAPILFEAGHCLWSRTQVDCELPLALYRYSRDTFGHNNTGIALWNCAERFWAGTGAGTETFGVKKLIEEASKDGVSIGCQTVGNFTAQPCRFSDPDVGNYGASVQGTPSQCQTDDPNFNPAQACIDTMKWFAGKQSQAQQTVNVKGTWLENWTKEYSKAGVYNTSNACKQEIDAFAYTP
ncbi:MAG TPA: hypothetical protein DCE42_20040 [Myxococcales bacterium]|nr:hypothetical protein [Myxococcales bacterium]